MYPSDIYQLTKDRFQIINKLQIFEEYLKIDQYEELQRTDTNYQQLDSRFASMMNKKRYIASVTYIKDLPPGEPNVVYDDFRRGLPKNMIERRERHFIIETLLLGFIEISSFCDFWSDIYILY